MFSSIVVYCVVSTLLVVVSSAQFFITPTGRSVPTSALQNQLRKSEVLDWSDHVFEVTSTNQLLSSTSSHDLSLLPLSQKSLHSPDSPPIFINNKRMHDTPFDYYSRKSADNSISVLSDVDGTTFAVLLNGTALHPVDHTFYPGIFLRKPASPNQKPDDEGALPIPPSAQTKTKHTPAPTTEADSPSAGKRDTCGPKDPPRAIETAIEFESTFCDWFSGRWAYATASILDAMEMAMMPYHRQTCLQLLITRVEGFCDRASDPYRSIIALDSGSALLVRMRDLWRPRTDVQRDFAYLFTGNIDDPDAIGRAYIGGICNAEYGFAWTENLPASTIGHEIGHLLEARHTTNLDIMDSRNRNRWGPRFFSVFTLQVFENFLRTNGMCVTADTRRKKKVILPDIQQSCERGFYRTGGFPIFKRWRKVGSATLRVGGGTENVNIQMYQNYFQAKIYISKPTSDYQILRWKRRLAMRKLRFKDLGQLIKMPSRKGGRNFVTEWSWGSITRPGKMATCCGKKLFVNFFFEACKMPAGRPCGRLYKVVKVDVEC